MYPLGNYCDSDEGYVSSSLTSPPIPWRYRVFLSPQTTLVLLFITYDFASKIRLQKNLVIAAHMGHNKLAPNAGPKVS